MVSHTASSTITEAVLRAQDLHVYYGSTLAVKNVDLDIPKNEITAFIGPSGCGKSTVLRCFNRTNDLISGARVEGKVTFHGKDLYASGVDPADVRRRIGMVFQRPNPFPKSIFEKYLLLGLALTATGAIWMSWLKPHCAQPPSGMK